jgi:hypothetical protein
MKRGQYSIRPFPSPWRFAVLPAALAVQWASSEAPALVERLYARGLYPRLSRALATLTGAVPFSLAEVLLFAALGWAVWGLLRAARALAVAHGRRLRTLGAAVARAAGALGALYAAFLVLWGFNYHRQPFAVASGLGEPSARVEIEELTSLCHDLIDEANAARAAMGEDGRGVARLGGGVRGALIHAEEALRTVSSRYAFVSGPYAPAKAVTLSIGLSYLGISGIFVPFTAEANVNVTLPEFDVPFTACHELAHQGGIAPEDEANYVAYVACRLDGDAEFRYSGALGAGLYALHALGQVDRQRSAREEARWSVAVRRDLTALAEWNALYRGPAQKASRAVNDAYLKAHGQAAGVRSYGRMVDLLILERRARDRSPSSGTDGSVAAITPGRPTAPEARPRPRWPPSRRAESLARG